MVNPKSADFSHAKPHVLYADVWQIHTFGVHRAGVRALENPYLAIWVGIPNLLSKADKRCSKKKILGPSA
ncbi:hypothetical protein RSOLAG1IB_00309 [Rhizoctonia solani AG-1 IB]|uniref:Uncharacterized protein n=1 Tax=Thanatephorus cucumeris (strain AG1-IB / isolate 7/3/14) TaxID=1108050 RepID=A0A0B7F4A6_THACB|nr:hypothetical protein RSOLAG1IB_00309 [Rhizoctonia solani AG-1 IB]